MNAENRKPTLSVVLTALNEEANVADAVFEITHAIEGRFDDYEILCIDDGSQDKTGAILDDLASRDPHLRVTHNPAPRNLGGAYKQGIAQARCDYLVWMPGDNENPATALIAPFEALGHADMILPYLANRKRSWFRNVASSGYTGLLNTIFGLNIRYYNGTVIHRVEALRSITIKTDSFAYQSEAIIKLLRAGKTYIEVPIEIDPKEGGRKSKAFRVKNIIGVLQSVVDLVLDVHVRPRFERIPGRGKPGAI